MHNANQVSTSIVRLFGILISKSWTLTSKNGCKISLTPRDLHNHCLRIIVHKTKGEQ